MADEPHDRILDEMSRDSLSTQSAREPEFVAPVLTDQLVWNLDTTLAQILAQGIGRLREMDHGHPAGLAHEDWLGILREMAAGFQQYADADLNCSDADYDKLNRSLDLLREWFPHLWD